MRRLQLLALLSLLATSACSRNERQSDDCVPSERVVDPVLLAFLSQARSAHHVADQHEATGDSAAALRALQALVSAAQPPGDPPEVGEVLADTRARMADLLSRAGRFDQADAEISEGLTKAKAPSYFRGHLLEVKGLVEERRAKALTSTGRGPEAEKARERSLSAYEEAMKIQAEVIQQAAPAASGGRRP
jgi:hypothetical protein